MNGMMYDFFNAYFEFSRNSKHHEFIEHKTVDDNANGPCKRPRLRWAAIFQNMSLIAPVPNMQFTSK